MYSNIARRIDLERKAHYAKNACGEFKPSTIYLSPEEYSELSMELNFHSPIELTSPIRRFMGAEIIVDPYLRGVFSSEVQVKEFRELRRFLVSKDIDCFKYSLLDCIKQLFERIQYLEKSERIQYLKKNQYDWS